MFVEVNGARLFFDVEGPKLVPERAALRERPTIVFLHGGPGFDHSGFRPAFSPLSDVAQLVFYDHRGNGRSGGNDPADWTLAQWGDDVKGFCDALGIEKPIVLGLSFGGFVAQSYATRHPDHPAKLILVSTVPRVEFETIYDMFGELGGPQARVIAKAYWDDPTAERRAAFIARCIPLYRRKGSDAEVFRRAILRPDTALHFNGPRNEHGRMDFRPVLGRVTCPVLLMSGDRDPITPIVFADELAAALRPDLVDYERFVGCGHGVHAEEPDRALALIRDFILEPR